MPPLVWVAIAWFAGLVIAHQAQVGAARTMLHPVPLLTLSLIPLSALLLWHKDRRMRLSAVCVLALLLGALRYQLAIPYRQDSGFVAFYNNQGWVTVEGVIRGYPDVRDTWTNLELDTERIEFEGDWHPVHGTVLIRAPRYSEHYYGDRLRVSGRLETPPELEGFSYRDYLERRGVYAIVYHPQIERLATGEGSPFWAAIYAAKDRASDVVARLVPDPEAALMQGILLGVETGIPRDLYDDYNATGTSHIIVISGSNITIIAALFAAAFGRLLSKCRAYWFTIAGIVLYVLLVRAGVICGLYVTARRLGRGATAYVSLFASAILLTAISPLALWDAGFQLSFAATGGLILFTPPIERLFERALIRVVPAERARRVVRYLNDVLIVTLAAQVFTLPLVLYEFGRLSLVAPLTNLLIMPAQPPIMIWGGAATLIGLVPLPAAALEPVARAIAWFPWLCLTYTNAVVQWMADWSFASLQVSHASAGRLVLCYSAILAAVWALRQRRGYIHRFWSWMTARWSTTAILGVPAVGVMLVWLAVVQLPDGKLHVAFLDVGQGDAILITTPDGQQVLVDGGSSPTALTSALGREMPFWDRSLDLLVLTHPAADHLTGLVEVLGRYRVDRWLDNGRPDDDAVYLECTALLVKNGVQRHVIHLGDRLDLGRGLALHVLHPPPDLLRGTEADANNNSVVLRLTWDGASFLLTGDIEAEAERLLVRSGQPLAADVLKIAHHGGGSSTAEFLNTVAPRYAVVSVGADNRFGHPKQDTLDRLASLGGVTVLRTDELGTVEFITDGQRLWVRTAH